MYEPFVINLEKMKQFLIRKQRSTTCVCVAGRLDKSCVWKNCNINKHRMIMGCNVIIDSNDHDIYPLSQDGCKCTLEEIVSELCTSNWDAKIITFLMCLVLTPWVLSANPWPLQKLLTKLQRLLPCIFLYGMSAVSCSGVLYVKADSSLDRLLTTLALCINRTSACTTSDIGGRNSGSGCTRDSRADVKKLLPRRKHIQIIACKVIHFRYVNEQVFIIIWLSP